MATQVLYSTLPDGQIEAVTTVLTLVESISTQILFGTLENGQVTSSTNLITHASTVVSTAPITTTEILYSAGTNGQIQAVTAVLTLFPTLSTQTLLFTLPNNEVQTSTSVLTYIQSICTQIIATTLADGETKYSTNFVTYITTLGSASATVTSSTSTSQTFRPTSGQIFTATATGGSFTTAGSSRTASVSSFPVTTPPILTSPTSAMMNTATSVPLISRTSTTASSSIATIPPARQAFIISLSTIEGRVERLSKRQTNIFVNPNGTTGEQCTNSGSYVLISDQLYVNAALITANITTLGYGLLTASASGNITGGFSLDSNDNLQWSNPGFTNGQASFCWAANGLVEAVYIQGDQPADCESITLSKIPATVCPGFDPIYPAITEPSGPSGPSGAPGQTGPQGLSGIAGQSGAPVSLLMCLICFIC